MQTRVLGAMNRRRAIGGTLAIGGALAIAGGAARAQQIRSRVVTQRGMIGGGLAQFQLSQANFSLVASRFIFTEENKQVVVGEILWVDTPSAFTFTSTKITNYDVINGPEEGEHRRVRGTMSLNGGQEYPFRLDVIDDGPPGSGLDTISLIVGDGAEDAASGSPVPSYGFSYAASGPIVSGDVNDVDFDIDPDSPDAVPATPVAPE